MRRGEPGDGGEPRWSDVRRALERVLEAPPTERAQRIREIAGGDPRLERELRELCEHDSGAAGLLDRPLHAPDALIGGEQPRSDERTQPGARIGPFELLRPLGSGGMGSVWLARQRDPERDVALKLLDVAYGPGHFARGLGGERWRFEYEAEVLATLRHPSIAQIHASGVHAFDGGDVLWIAMELVEDARDLIAWADERGADRAERLRLFREVASAVAYGHRRGVIHRDLKPANILVDREGRVRLIDFGVARAVEGASSERASRTRTGELVGTLQYMAPEQLSGREIDVRCDVYSLGVVLYRLLCGAPPFEFEGASFAKIARAVIELEPRPPSSLAPGIDRDLECVLYKALEKDPMRRYGGVDELLEDLRRIEADEVVSARPPTAIYRLRKFARRHRAAVGVASAVVAGLVLSIVGIAFGLSEARAGERAALESGREAERQAKLAGESAEVARAEGERASAEASRNQHVLQLFEGLFEGVDDTIDGREVKVADLLESSVLRVDGGAQLDPDTELVVRAVLGKMYSRLKLFERARSELERALEVFPSTQRRPADRVRELESRALLGMSLARLGDDRAGEELMRAAAAAAEQSGLEDALGGATMPLVEYLHDEGRFEDVRDLAAPLRAFAIRTGRAELERVATELLALGLSGMGCADDALPLHESHWLRASREYGSEHWRAVDALVTYSLALQRADRLQEAEAMIATALPLLSKVRGPNHELTLSLLNNRALLAAERGDPEATAERLREVLFAYETLESPPVLGVLTVLVNLGNVLVGMNRYEDAEPYLRRGAELSGELAADNLKGCQARFNYGTCLGALLRWPEAEPLLLSSFDCLKAGLPTGHPVVVGAARTIATCYSRNGFPDQAATWRGRASAEAGK